MFDCQRQLLSFLYLGRSDDNCLTLSGKEVEKVVAETGSLQRNFNKDIFLQEREKTMSVHTCRLFCFILQETVVSGRSRSFVFLKKYTVSARVFPALSFSVSCMKQRCCSSGDSQVSFFIRYTHWEVLAGTVNVLSCIGLPCFFPSKSVTFISNIRWSLVSGQSEIR